MGVCAGLQVGNIATERPNQDVSTAEAFIS